MEKQIRVLMIDDNESSIRKVKEYFSSHAVIKVVDEAHDGEEGLKKILASPNAYDVILMDLIMPKKDGISLLEDLKKNHISKKVIVLTSYKKEETIQRVSELDVSYYMLKPFNLVDLEKRIIEINTNAEFVETPSKDKALQLNISKLLHALGIPSHIKGYQYIRESIYLMYHNPEMIGGITKELYPEIATKFDTTSSRVERAIRHAIEVSWNRGDYDLMEEIFGHSVDYDRAKPTNSEFIATLADKLRLDHDLVHI